MGLLKPAHFRRLQFLNYLHDFVRSREPLTVKSLRLYKHGKPVESLRLEDEKICATDEKQVLIKVDAAPIHPIHLDFIYGEKTVLCGSEASLPVVLGNECVGEVVSVGDYVKDLSVGQRVVITYPNPFDRGTWSTYALYDAEHVVPIPKDIGIYEAAILSMYPLAAYRILRDYINLNPGDCVLFDGGFSVLGQSLHQLCRAWDIKSISVVRDNSDKIVDHLKMVGANKIFTKPELLETDIFERGKYPKPRLVLSCAARSSSKVLGKFLDPDGLMVTYGCIARAPATAVTASFIFKDFVHRPIWITHCSVKNTKKCKRIEIINEFYELIKKKKFSAPGMKLVPFANYEEAFIKLDEYKGTTGTRFLLDMREDPKEAKNNC